MAADKSCTSHHKQQATAIGTVKAVLPCGGQWVSSDNHHNKMNTCCCYHFVSMALLALVATGSLLPSWYSHPLGSNIFVSVPKPLKCDMRRCHCPASQFSLSFCCHQLLVAFQLLKHHLAMLQVWNYCQLIVASFLIISSCCGCTLAWQEMNQNDNTNNKSALTRQSKRRKSVGLHKHNNDA